MQSRAALVELNAWLDQMVDLVLPQSALGGAIHYALGQYPKLTHFLEHPDIPLDTNRVNAIRPFCGGRRN